MTPRTPLTPAVLRSAADYVQEHGLDRTDDSYGRKNGPCCTFGTLAMVTYGDPEAITKQDEDGWALVLDPDSTPGTIIEWSDRQATTQDVADLYLEAAARLDGEDAT